MNKRKGFYLLLLSLFLLAIIGIEYWTHDYDQYQGTLFKVQNEKIVEKHQERDEHGNQDVKTKQQLTGVLLNTKDKGQTLVLSNTYSHSQVYDAKYQVGDILLIKRRTLHTGEQSADILSLKRDRLISYCLLVTLFLLALIGHKQGVLSFVSLIVNTGILVGMTQYYVHTNPQALFKMFVLGAGLFTVVSLVILNGWNHKTWALILSTLLGTFLSFFISWLAMVILQQKGIRYEEMDFITKSPHLIFLSGLLVGCLGAVMDVSMTIITSLEELLTYQPNLSQKELWQSSQVIGGDIMGPMANVLLFAYLSGALPLILLYLRNDMSYTFTFSMILSLEFIRAVAGSIGIVLTVPISSWLGMYFFNKFGVTSS